MSHTRWVLWVMVMRLDNLVRIDAPVSAVPWRKLKRFQNPGAFDKAHFTIDSGTGSTRASA
jgi:hypothetical protein